MEINSEKESRVELLKEIFDEKVIVIISLFLENPKKHFTLTDIAEESGISLATAHRRLNALSSVKILNANKKKNSKKVRSYVLEKGGKVSALFNIFEQKSFPETPKIYMPDFLIR